MKNIKDITQLKMEKSEKVRKGPFYFFKWILKVEIIILAVFMCIGIAFNSISDKTKFIIKYNIEKELYSNIKNENYSYENIIDIIQENKHLKNEEKEFINKVLKNELIENKDYIDISKIVKRLKNLKIQYKKDELKNPINRTLNIVGIYNSISNEISLYELKPRNRALDKGEHNFDFYSCNPKVLFHELNHMITINSTSTFMNTWAQNLEKTTSRWDLWNDITDSIKIVNKNVFLEAINEIFTIEYFEEQKLENQEIKIYQAYEDDMVYAYVLAEILPEEVIRKYKFYDNESILVSGLLEIDNNIDEVYKLFTSINKVSVYKDTKVNLEEEYKQIYEGYAYFYEKKYNKNMTEDLEILLYLYNTPIQKEEEKKFIRSYLGMEEYDEIVNIIPKGYFSDNYKDNHMKVKVEYYKDGTLEFVEI